MDIHADQPATATRQVMTSRQRGIVRIETALLIALGAFAGANCRYLIGLSIHSSLLSTAFVNVAGSFALGALTQEAQLVGMLSQRSQRVLGTGFLSSFTTYSTFVLDAVAATPVVAMLYVLASYALGFIGAFVGHHAVSSLSTNQTGGNDI